ncbi:hypothetical protein QBC46DRAFT_103871 [Diplogelasinospora grovesii]|uniref:CBM1 domain-containing protein n=1 Tax=Diplogelasinospora grovesii TaxID=303347 RepID=A0AAN6N8W8_9PEZI|nr:hypothetical protein QBC46DRAFT_103871 [Diplogelasinospora grovesii]
MLSSALKLPAILALLVLIEAVVGDGPTITTTTSPQESSATGPIICVDYLNECGMMYGGCFASTSPWPTFSKPPCATTTSTSKMAEPTQTRWGQCGGIGWTGAVTCGSPYTCTYLNDWYSQCA